MTYKRLLHCFKFSPSWQPCGESSYKRENGPIITLYRAAGIIRFTLTDKAVRADISLCAKFRELEEEQTENYHAIHTNGLRIYLAYGRQEMAEEEIAK